MSSSVPNLDQVPRLVKYPSMESESIGMLLGDRYILEQSLGRGGMGLVLQARHVYLGRTFAVKLLRPELLLVDRSKARFLREAQTCASIRHKNVVDITDFGVTKEGLHYLVMEHLHGVDLHKYLSANGPLPLDRLVEIGAQVTEALAAVHKHGIVHRDLKPENIWLVDKPGSDELHVKVLDFGIAGIVSDDEGHETLTEAGQVVGTPRYMAPEQCRGEELDGRADVYSLGCVIWELATGRSVFEGKSAAEVMTAQLLRPVSPPSTVRPGLPEWFDQVCLRALAKFPESRYQSAEALRDALLNRDPGPEIVVTGQETAAGHPRARTPSARAAAAAETLEGSASRPSLPPTLAGTPAPTQMPAGFAPTLDAVPASSQGLDAQRAALPTLPPADVTGGLPARNATGKVEAQQSSNRVAIFAVAAVVLAVGTAFLVGSNWGADNAGDRGNQAPPPAAVAPTPEPAPKPAAVPSEPVVAAAPKPKVEPVAVKKAEPKPAPAPSAVSTALTPCDPREPEWGMMRREARPYAALPRFEVHLTSTPTKAEVFDGENVIGETPLTLSGDFLSKRHLLLVVPGHEEVLQAVAFERPKEGKSIEVAVELPKIKRRRPPRKKPGTGKKPPKKGGGGLMRPGG